MRIIINNINLTIKLYIRIAKLGRWLYVFRRYSTGFGIMVFFEDSGRIFSLILLTLTNRVIKVVLNGHDSSSFHLNAGVPTVLSLNIRCFFSSSVSFPMTSVPNHVFMLMTQLLTHGLVESPTYPTK